MNHAETIGTEPRSAMRRAWPDGLTAAAGVLFLFLLMLLPLVGPAASRGSGSPGATRAPHYAKNVVAFLSVWLLTLLATAVAIGARRRVLQRSSDRWSRFLWAEVVVLLGILVAFLTGALAI